MPDDDPSAGAAILFIQTGLRNQLIDRVTVEVSEALAAEGIASILLKGPAIATWLYDRSEVRAYGDSDLLIQHDHWTRATALLQRLGFTHDVSEMAHPRMESFASDPWYRGNDNLDLHSIVYGIGANPTRIWSVFSATAVPIEVAGAQLRALGLPARTLHIALHAAQHQDGKAVADLERALERLDLELWQAAASLAARLDALAAFAGGLKLLPQGEELSRRLAVSGARSIRMDLRSSGVPMTEGLFELWEAPGPRAKLRVVRDEIVPKPAFMRWWSPLARRGRLGLAAAYAWRPIYLLAHAPAAVREVWRASRRAKTPG
jgi:hypothetical protein